MDMRADRLLSILLLLQIHGQMTSRELARRLEVSERTIHRDMEALSASGVPVMAERGAGGGWALPEGYQTNLTGLNAPEIQSLFFHRPLRMMADLGLADAAEGALTKLLATLPPDSRRTAEYIRQRIHVDMAGWQRGGESVEFLPVLQEAVWHDRQVRILYQKNDGTASERVLNPLGLVAKGSVWYLVAAASGGEPRTYRVSRVQGAEVLDAPCERPAGFDLAKHWGQSSAEFVAQLPRFQVVLRAKESILQRMRWASRWSQVEQVSPADEVGWCEVAVRFEEEWNAVEFVLSFGGDVEVLSPSSLRDKVLDAARAVVAVYS
ncbi:MAG: Helix-turn-helix type 11 domain protein [Symbiobacteriaceae bacterium]|jgi:predicted DNA-binding transcriptional regulator YafY|nr:Helix-turn-helix type 11 domain protein [Symbiobacteriaceae bacterium]